MVMPELVDNLREIVWGPYERWIVATLAIAIGVLIALAVHRLVFGIVARIARASDSKTDDVVIRQIARPTRWGLVALAMVVAAREVPALADVWERIAGLLMPPFIGWIALAIVRALVEVLALRNDLSATDNLQARRRQTRLAIFSRIGTFLIIAITVGLMLRSIPGVRDIGITLMASAGLAGLAVGAAAQPALKSLIAGLQMALTEPIRIDDVVVIDGEWGRIEDIRTTYVVVRLWDERRLVVPTTRFLEDTFENWTRQGAELLGTVFLHLDPLADIGPIRAEFERQVEASELWDKRVRAAQVTDSGPGSIELRLLMSARDAPTAFDLRCRIREGMLAWIREHCPAAIMRARVLPAGPVEMRMFEEREADRGEERRT